MMSSHEYLHFAVAHFEQIASLFNYLDAVKAGVSREKAARVMRCSLWRASEILKGLVAWGRLTETVQVVSRKRDKRPRKYYSRKEREVR